MNKITKFLAFVGLSSAVAYVAYGLKGKQTPALEKSSESSPRMNSTKKNARETTKKEPPQPQDQEHSNARTQKMFKDLGMTEEQQRQYERDYRTIMGTSEKNNSKKGGQQKTDEHDSLMNAVLNEAQYSMYRDWFKNNPA